MSSASFLQSNSEFVHANNSKTHYKINNSYGISILPGYQFLPATLFYGRLAYSNAHLKITTSDVSLTNKTQRLDGFRYGLGVKQAITDRTSLRLEYNRINYNSVKLRTLDSVSQTTKNTKISPTQQLVEFGLVYSFN